MENRMNDKELIKTLRSLLKRFYEYKLEAGKLEFEREVEGKNIGNSLLEKEMEFLCLADEIESILDKTKEYDS